MKINDILKSEDFSLITGKKSDTDKEIKGCYIGDLLSLAMAKVEEGFLWITIQTNINVVAVSSLKEASCVIVADGYQIEESVKNKAEDEGVLIISTKLSSYEVASYLVKSGL